MSDPILRRVGGGGLVWRRGAHNSSSVRTQSCSSKYEASISHVDFEAFQDLYYFILQLPLSSDKWVLPMSHFTRFTHAHTPRGTAIDQPCSPH